MMTDMQSTSLEAYRTRVLPCLAKSQATVFQILDDASRSNFDMTNMELASALHWSINRVTPRVFELRGMGLVVKSQKRKCGVTGNMAYAWRVNQK